jgi:hypothetical protein
MGAIDLRLRRLERARRDRHGVFFLAMGRDDAEIETAIANGRASLTLQPGDLVVRLRWRGEDVPQSRWILTPWSQPDIGETLSKDERSALDEECDRLREEVLRKNEVPQTRLAGVTVASSKFAASGPSDQWSDEQLIASILGEPVD